jgi:hypothetical protein
MHDRSVMTILRTSSMLWLATLGLLIACDRDDVSGSHRSGHALGVANTQPVSTIPQTSQSADQPAGGVTTSVEGQTVDRLTSVRCALESSCDRVGSGKTFVSRDQCLKQIRASVTGDLDSFQCDKGFDTNAVETCATAIEHFDCGLAFATIDTVPACRSADLCGN